MMQQASKISEVLLRESSSCYQQKNSASSSAGAIDNTFLSSIDTCSTNTGTNTSSPKFPIDSFMLDFDFVDQCKDIITLKEILRVLISGKEGYYPDLTRAVEDRIMNLLPDREREDILKQCSSLPSSSNSHPVDCSKQMIDNSTRVEEEDKEVSELQDWIHSMAPSQEHGQVSHENSQANENNNNILPPFTNIHIPPVRVRGVKQQDSKEDTERVEIIDKVSNEDVEVEVDTSNTRTGTESNQKKSSFDSRICKERLSNRDYFRAWDTFDVDAAEAAVDLDADPSKDEREEKKIKSTTKSSSSDQNKHDVKPLIVEIDSVSTEDSPKSKQPRKPPSQPQQKDGRNRRDMAEEAAKRSLGTMPLLSETERKFMAEKEKVLGNEAFADQKYQQAILNYTRAILLIDACSISTSAMDMKTKRLISVVLSNRALSWTKLSEYDFALEDCKNAIHADPTFSKPYARRGMIYHQQRSHSTGIHQQQQQAIDDLERAVVLEPQNKEYQKLLEQYREKLNNTFSANKRRIKIVDEISTGPSTSPKTKEPVSVRKRVVVIEDSDSDSDDETCIDNDRADESSTCSNESEIIEIYTPGARLEM